MTRSTIAVAPREITDLAYRACRVAGCDASVADRIAQDIAGCAVHRGCGVARLASLLSDHALVGTFRSTQMTHLEAGRSGCCVECEGVDSSSAVDPDVERVALANGLEIDPVAWVALENAASGFVLSEAIIDAADTPTV